MNNPSSQTQTPPAGLLGVDKLGLGILLYAYASLLGAAYLFAFWRPFGFNIFPFLSPLDYVSAPLDRLLVLIAAPILISMVLLDSTERIEPTKPLMIVWSLMVLYITAFVTQSFEAYNSFVSSNFYFNNEKTVLSYTLAIFLAGIWCVYLTHKKKGGPRMQIISLLLLQIALAMNAGYTDGKTIFNGAENVMLLDNKDLCEEKGVRDWVFVGKSSEQTFFMNTIDKRLCVTSEKNYNLISRKFKEKL